MKTLEKPIQSIAASISNDAKAAKERERKALATGYLEQINKVSIEIRSRLNNWEVYPTEHEVNLIAEFNTFLAEMFDGIKKETY